jgi:hypothetical protein
MEIDTNIVEATENDSILTLSSEPAFALHRQLLAMSSATVSTEAALNSFATVSLKPLLRFIASECVATMPPNDLSLVDFVIKLLVANKDRLEQESRISADRPPLPSNAVKVGTQVLQERPHVDNDVTVAKSTDTIVDFGSSLIAPAVGASALHELARDRVDKGFQRRDYSFLHDV